VNPTVALQRSLPCDSLILTVNGAMGEANSKTNRDPEYHFVQKQRHGLRVTIAMDQLGHVDYPVPLSVQENFATVAIYQRFSFFFFLGLGSHRER